MARISKISYTKATITQLAKTKKIYDDKGFADCLNIKEAIDLIKIKGQDKFDRWGRPTMETQQKRINELLKLNLPENTTIQDFIVVKLQAKTENIIKILKNTVKEI